MQMTKTKTLPGFEFESALWRRGLKFVAGADEVGRGSFAGPVVAACVVFDPTLQGRTLQDTTEIRINDSKKLTVKRRQVADIWIRKNALSFGIGDGSVSQINAFGIKKATEIAFRKAVKETNKKLTACGDAQIAHLLVDAFFVKNLAGIPVVSVKKYEYNSNSKVRYSVNQTAIVKGDQQSFSIASASIIAKIYRDDLMKKLSLKKKFKVYEWGKNKGYGTKTHQEAIVKFGQTKYHRKEFVKTFLSKKTKFLNLNS